MKKINVDDEALLRFEDVMKRVAISRSQIDKMIREGKFPIKFSHYGRRVVWRKSDISAWIAEKIKIAGI